MVKSFSFALAITLSLSGCSTRVHIKFSPGISIQEAVTYARAHKAEVVGMGRVFSHHGEEISQGLYIEPGMSAEDIEMRWALFQRQSLERGNTNIEATKQQMERADDPNIKEVYRRGIRKLERNLEEAKRFDDVAYGKTIRVTSLSLLVNPFRSLEQLPETEKMERFFF